MEPGCTLEGPGGSQVDPRRDKIVKKHLHSQLGASFSQLFPFLGVQSASQERPRASQERPKSAQKGLDSSPGGLQRRPGERSGTTLEGFFRQPSPERRFGRLGDVFGVIFDSRAKAPTWVSYGNLQYIL